MKASDMRGLNNIYIYIQLCYLSRLNSSGKLKTNGKTLWTHLCCRYMQPLDMVRSLLDKASGWAAQRLDQQHWIYTDGVQNTWYPLAVRHPDNENSYSEWSGELSVDYTHNIPYCAVHSVISMWQQLPWQSVKVAFKGQVKLWAVMFCLLFQKIE